MGSDELIVRHSLDAIIDMTLKPPEAYDPAGSGNFPTTYGGETVQQGDSFRIVTADTLGTGTIVNPEDLLIAFIDSPGQTDTNWMVIESNRDQATETVKGVAEIATQVETDAEIDDLCFVTPLKLGKKVSGPVSATDNAIAIFDGTTGKVIKGTARALLEEKTLFGALECVVLTLDGDATYPNSLFFLDAHSASDLSAVIFSIDGTTTAVFGWKGAAGFNISTENGDSSEGLKLITGDAAVSDSGGISLSTGTAAGTGTRGDITAAANNIAETVDTLFKVDTSSAISSADFVQFQNDGNTEFHLSQIDLGGGVGIAAASVLGNSVNKHAALTITCNSSADTAAIFIKETQEAPGGGDVLHIGLLNALLGDNTDTAEIASYFPLGIYTRDKAAGTDNIGVYSGDASAGNSGNINHTTGTASGTRGDISDDSYNRNIKLGDNAAATKLFIKDSDGSTVATIDSNGNLFAVGQIDATGNISSGSNLAAFADITAGLNISATGTVTGANLSGINTGDQNDHGSLDDLGDDDHSQYHNDGRGDARYYLKSEVDVLVDATMKAPEAYDPTVTGNYPITYEGNSVEKGDSFRITAAGTMGGITVNIEDLLIALVDTPAQVDANWMVAESNRDQATETVKGVALVSTQAKTDTGTDDESFVTPLKLAGTIGTTIQAYDATLQSFSALGTVADRLAYTTAVDTWAETALTAFARSILDDADAATASTTLGLGIADTPQFAGLGLGGAPGASAIFQADSTTKGLLPPRMTSTQRNAIASPAAGLILYDSTTNTLDLHDGTTWRQFIVSEDSTLEAGGIPFATSGCCIDTDSANLFWDNTNKRLGIGTAAPNATLDVTGITPGSVGGFPAGVLQVTSPNAAVNASAVITGHNSYGGNKQLWYLGSSSSSNDNITLRNRQNGNLALATNDLDRVTIQGDGKIDAPGIYTETDASAANVFVASDGSLRRSTSSRKIKKDIIENINPAWALQFKPVTFKSRLNNAEHMGFIAEDMQAIDERFATDGDLPGLEMNAIVAALTATIQEQQRKIEILESHNN